MARLCKHKGQRQAKSKKENRYVIKIKVMSSNREGGAVCGSLGSREPKDAPSLFIGQ
jgi:hypothetical protein